MGNISERASHIGSATDESKFFAIALQMLSIPRTLKVLDQVDALVAWPGIVLDAAVRHAISNWQSDIGKHHLLIAGYHEPDVANCTFTLERMQVDLYLNRTEGVHTQVNASHAGEQATWVANKVKELGIKSFALYIPAFHLARGMLTTIESLRRLDIRIPIVPVPTPLSPFERALLNAKTGERNLSEMDVIHAEANPRMKNYQVPKSDGSPGDVATDEVWENYLRFLYSSPFMLPHLMSACP